MEEEDLIDYDNYQPTINEPEDDDATAHNVEENTEDLFSPASDYAENVSYGDDLDGNPIPVQDDFVSEVLRRQGFSNRNAIPILDEDGDPTTVNFDDLSRAEQLDLLTTPTVVLSDDEINTINFLRNNNLTLQQFADGYARNYSAYTQQPQDHDYVQDVMGAPDEELFKADLRHKYPDLTPEEVESELDDAMLNEDLFKRKVRFIREQFMNTARLANQESIEKRQAVQQLQDRDFYERINDAANNIDYFQGILIEDSDKDEVMEFMLERDVNGLTQFQKLLQDPNEMFKLAWFAKKGEEAMQMLHRYYRGEITNARRQGKQSADERANKPRVAKKQSGKSSRALGDKYELSAYFN